MRIYWKYFKYVLEHKKNVFIQCWKNKMYLHAFTHDMSKFHPKEFFAYAEYFYGDYNPNSRGFVNNQEKIDSVKENFDKAWQHHKDNNKHHWNYWHERNLEMPTKYIDQMICDWSAMSMKFGDTPKDFYERNEFEIHLHPISRLYLEFKLNVISTHGADSIRLSLIKSLFNCEISSLLQIGYGIMLENREENKNIGYIHPTAEYLGGEITIENIVVYYNKELTDVLRKEFIGKKLILDTDDNIW